MIESQKSADRTIERILQITEQYGVDAYVVGLPLNMDGTEGPQARKTRAFGNRLGRLSNRPVHFRDERLSSHGADDCLADAQVTPAKRSGRRDAVAAQIILQSFLDHRRTQGDSSPSDPDSPGASGTG